MSLTHMVLTVLGFDSLALFGIALFYFMRKSLRLHVAANPLAAGNDAKGSLGVKKEICLSSPI
jgi:hypothetical protein